MPLSQEDFVWFELAEAAVWLELLIYIKSFACNVLIPKFSRIEKYLF
ncbi:hypothetical protein [Acinetobacter nosocomialis]